MKIQFQYSIPAGKKEIGKTSQRIHVILRQEQATNQMVQHIRKPGIKADFMGKFLKLGPALLPSPLQISVHQQTPVHLTDCKSPGKGKELFRAAGDSSRLSGLTTSDPRGQSRGRFSGTSKTLHGLQKNLACTQRMQKARPR